MDGVRGVARRAQVAYILRQKMCLRLHLNGTCFLDVLSTINSLSGVPRAWVKLSEFRQDRSFGIEWIIDRTSVFMQNAYLGS